MKVLGITQEYDWGPGRLSANFLGLAKQKVAKATVPAERK